MQFLEVPFGLAHILPPKEGRVDDLDIGRVQVFRQPFGVDQGVCSGIGHGFSPYVVFRSVPIVI